VAARFVGVNLTKIHTPDVHELLSINAGLRAAQKDGRQQRGGFNIILLDDVILADRQFEAKVRGIYAQIPNLGYISFRLGANFREDAATFGPAMAQTEEIESAHGAGITEDVLMPGYFAERTIPIKSPTCLPTAIVSDLGMFNEDLAPYAYDDYEMAIRTTVAGYRNGVYALRFFSDVRWGGSRKPGHPDIQVMVRRNGAYIRERCAAGLKQICSKPQSTRTYRATRASSDENAFALGQYAKSKSLIAAMNA